MLAIWNSKQRQRKQNHFFIQRLIYFAQSVTTLRAENRYSKENNTKTKRVKQVRVRAKIKRANAILFGIEECLCCITFFSFAFAKDFYRHATNNENEPLLHVKLYK